ncbi:PHB depolymerase family esterase [Actibacterium sp. 188UL27-1]|uniref:alpha/beta hydrolase family esterase n=1 Tax=Actibacterium sp. 188UL27-1 TaxID=2786961 RepID=UPI00195D18D1|nr:PHB depolymerase family esterase [Actibacterium sp. 188UL27-1]MBM7066432.1 polyhydroxybutyrate depolymerase [Actibacterium sp. 188UL27-1]
MTRFLIALLAVSLPSLAWACGPDSDCQIDDGTYRIRMPEAVPAGTRPGAIVFAHGYRGSSQGTMRNGSLENLAQDLGVALIALNASADDWTIPNSPQEGRVRQRDEVAYAARVLDDAVAQFGIDPDRVLATGFSAGGMMTWTLACNDSARYAGFAPLSGTFWAPEPTTCPAPPANLIHYHGTTDNMVPLAGRPIAQTSQGDITKVMQTYATNGGYAAAGTSQPLTGLTCEARENTAGKYLEICLFDGGHTFKVDYIRRAWEMFVPGA